MPFYRKTTINALLQKAQKQEIAKQEKEKKFKEELFELESTMRRQALGQDRYNNRLWYVKEIDDSPATNQKKGGKRRKKRGHKGMLLVEHLQFKGKPDSSNSNGGTNQFEEVKEEKGGKYKKKKKGGKVERRDWGPNDFVTVGWSYYDSREQLDALMAAMNTNGVREKVLLRNLQKHYSILIKHLSPEQVLRPTTATTTATTTTTTPDGGVSETHGDTVVQPVEGTASAPADMLLVTDETEPAEANQAKEGEGVSEVLQPDGESAAVRIPPPPPNTFTNCFEKKYHSLFLIGSNLIDETSTEEARKKKEEKQKEVKVQTAEWSRGG